MQFVVNMVGFFHEKSPWFLSNPGGNVMVRVPEHVNIAENPQHLVPCPDAFLRALHDFPQSKNVDRPVETTRQYGKEVVVIADFGIVQVSLPYVRAVQTLHGDVLTWRGSDAWSQVYACKGPTLVGIIYPLLPRALGVA